MPCLITNNIDFCDYSTGGIKRLFLTNKSFIAGVIFQDDNEGLIKDFVSSDGLIWWLEFSNNEATTTINESLQRSDNGNIYKVDLNTTFIKIEEAKRNALKQIIEGEVVAVVEDFNGKFWALGDTDGLKAFNYAGGSDSAGGVSSYDITLTGFQRHQLREVDFSAVDAFWVAVEDCSQYAGQPISAIPPPIQNIYECLIDFSN